MGFWSEGGRSRLNLFSHNVSARENNLNKYNLGFLNSGRAKSTQSFLFKFICAKHILKNPVLDFGARGGEVDLIFCSDTLSRDQNILKNIVCGSGIKESPVVFLFFWVLRPPGVCREGS